MSLKEYLSATVEALKEHGEEQNANDFLTKGLKEVIRTFEKEILASGVYIDLKIKHEILENNLDLSPEYYLTWESKDIRTHVRLYKRTDLNGFNYQFQKNPSINELLLTIENLPLFSEKIKEAYTKTTAKLKLQREEDIRNIKIRISNLPESLQVLSNSQLSKFLN